jgi:2-keto-4-pentenoate hydratase/2-oxohepta-3-ene-1,7-dioic acid hydratase in catechol pathway
VGRFIPKFKGGVLMHLLQFSIDKQDILNLSVKNSVCIGYSGRNQEMVKKHIDELAHEVIAPPPSVPMVYPVSNILVTQDEEIDVLGNKTSGEVEFVLLINNEGTYVTVGSDHTDRELEGYSIPYAKQATPKPVAKQAWVLEEVLDHWDDLNLTCEISINNNWEVYQAGNISAVMPVNRILEFAHSKNAVNEAGTIMFCGTVPIAGGTFKYANAYRLTLKDPVLERSIHHEYSVRDITVQN